MSRSPKAACRSGLSFAEKVFVALAGVALVLALPFADRWSRTSEGDIAPAAIPNREEEAKQHLEETRAEIARMKAHGYGAP